jgi:O-methyltransferase
MAPTRLLAALLRKGVRLFSRSSFFIQGHMNITRATRWYREEFVTQTGGFYLAGDPMLREIVDIDPPWDLVRRNMLILLLRTVVERRVPGDLAEMGVYQGHTAKLIHYYVPDRPLHLFDTFCGFDQRDLSLQSEPRSTTKWSPHHFADTSVAGVRRYIEPRTDNVFLHPGYFPESIPTGFDPRFCFVHLDADLYEPTMAGLTYFYARLSPGGMLVVHDYNTWVGARTAVDA